MRIRCIHECGGACLRPRGVYQYPDEVSACIPEKCLSVSKKMPVCLFVAEAWIRKMERALEPCLRRFSAPEPATGPGECRASGAPQAGLRQSIDKGAHACGSMSHVCFKTMILS